MKTKLRGWMTLLLALAVVSSGPALALDVDVDAEVERIAFDVAGRAGWLELNGASAADESSETRTQVVDDVYHYVFDITFGDGPYDRFRLHRVVRELYPTRPIFSRNAILMVHGSVQDFASVFLAQSSTGAYAEKSLALSLAQRDVDVWGIDLPFTQVPVEETDFSFMADWGLQREIDITMLAVGTAKSLRRVTGTGVGKLNLLTYSFTVPVGYGVLDAESSRFCFLRNVKTLIAIEGYLKLDPNDPVAQAVAKPLACFSTEADYSAIDAGVYENSTGALILNAGLLAASAPSDPSPLPSLLGPPFTVFEGLTNAEFALALTGQLWKLGITPTPWYHFFAPIVDDEGKAIALEFVETAENTDFLLRAEPYEARLYAAEVNGMACDDPSGPDYPWDDDLGRITAPTMQVAAGGGLSSLGAYTLTLLGSDETRFVEASTDPDEVFDTGHVDILLGEGAEERVWDPIYEWVIEHERTNCR